MVNCWISSGDSRTNGAGTSDSDWEMLSPIDSVKPNDELSVGELIVSLTVMDSVSDSMVSVTSALSVEVDPLTEDSVKSRLTDGVAAADGVRVGGGIGVSVGGLERVSVAVEVSGEDAVGD